jgi:hypothetical protein
MIRHFPRILLIGVLSIAVVACSSDEESEAKKKRRGAETSTTKKTTSTTSATESTVPVVERPLLSAAEIKAQWPESKLCAVITPAKAQAILKMDTLPVAQYNYAETIGAQCLYTSGAGDELYVEISATSYKESRSIDLALNGPGEEVVVSGVAGVLKEESAFGSIYELNVWGANSNQWVATAPTTAQAKQVANVVIEEVS